MRRITRRRFVSATAGAAGATLLSPLAGRLAAAPAIPTRPFGKTGVQVTMIVLGARLSHHRILAARGDETMSPRSSLLGEGDCKQQGSLCALPGVCGVKRLGQGMRALPASTPADRYGRDMQVHRHIRVGRTVPQPGRKTEGLGNRNRGLNDR
jgi:hypothetical protein